MKRVRRILALTLCVLMMFPTQGMFTLADSPIYTEETELPDENTEEKGARVEETLPLTPIEETDSQGAEETESEMDGEPVIYWNPGTSLIAELATGSNANPADEGVTGLPDDAGDGAATASNAGTSTASNAKTAVRAKAGNDRADGRTPSTPVKTLRAALDRAEELREELGISASDITIYAMNPMEVADGELYILNVGNMRIVSWPGRSYNNDTIFYLNGGQLTLVNARLEAGDPSGDPEATELVYMKGGILQMGQKVAVNGRIIMDYLKKDWEIPWETATGSDALIDSGLATKSNAGKNDKSHAAEGEAAVFDMSEYILDQDEDSLELIEDTSAESTWRKPIIQLAEGFIADGEQYLLEVRDDGGSDEIELVESLYADESTEEEFLELFTLSESTESSWRLETGSQDVARVRDTGVKDLLRFAALSGDEVLINSLAEKGTLTQKTLKATRAGSDKIVYWNPGGALTAKGEQFPEGLDEGNDGNTPYAPVRSWDVAIKKANGGTIISMQSVYLNDDAAEFIGERQDGGRYPDGSFRVASSSTETMATLKVWDTQPQPAFVVGAGEVLVLENIILEGIEKEGVSQSTQTVLGQKGDIIIGRNVTAETGYIQITAFDNLKGHPVVADSLYEEFDGIITLYFGGINNNLSYRYTDVVVPSERLMDGADADVIGKALLDRFRLDIGNRITELGGFSRFDWYLRQDTREDDNVEVPQNLELYAEYYFDAIYMDGERGNDENYGATCEYPVKTWDRAKTIWKTEMKKSLEAREAARDDGKSPAEIEELYPLPKVLYICGTMTVDESAVWELEENTDYNGSTVVTEVVSHTHIAQKDGNSGEPVHELPKLLINVSGGAQLTLKNVVVRNITDEKDSFTAQAEDGSKLIVTGTTRLTGERLADAKTGDTAKVMTYGGHVNVRAGGTLHMDEHWEGAIERREQGVVASGEGANVVMDAGAIRENSSFDQVIYDNNKTDHKRGSGVILEQKASFTMNGGEISDNTVYQYGAGVYMKGAGTSFTMNKGRITGNKMGTRYLYYSTSSNVLGYGIGIYAENGTILNIGTASGSKEDTVISENTSYYAYGVGIYTDTEVKIQNAVISDNVSNYSVYGGGIHAARNSLLQMDGVDVDGNRSSNSSTSYGIGIYVINNKTGNYIKNSSISQNTVNYYSSYGGGIYATTTLDIDNCTIDGNNAGYGAGIYINGTLTVAKTSVSSNTTAYTTGGTGGGIYIASGTVTLKDGTDILSNQSCGGGGIYLNSGTLNMRAEEAGGIKINNNKTTYNSTTVSHTGGAIYTYGGTLWAKNVEIIGNESVTNGGGIYANGGRAYFRDCVISGNRAVNGAGIYLSGSEKYYLTDCELTGNLASGNGGGAFLSNSNCELHISETGDGKFLFSGNEAANGGGLYTNSSTNTNSGVFYMDITGKIQNQASTQGSNLYIGGANSWIMGGEYAQSDESGEEVYNIYVDVKTSSNLEHYLFLDLSRVTVDKRIGGEPNVIFLNTGNSYLSYLGEPPNNTYGEFPIDLNREVFKVGSVVAKPAAKEKQTVLKVNEAVTGLDSVTRTYENLKDASIHPDYSSGGIVPRRTQLGGYGDALKPDRINMVLLGEGIYLSSEGKDGEDGHDGSSPVKAVKTFGYARTALEQKIQTIHDYEENPVNGVPDEKKEGFSPFIYICGTVEIGGAGETWELNYDSELFTDTNKNYIIAETGTIEGVHPAQVRRFASFITKPMITVGDGTGATQFQLDKILINGMAEAVISNEQDSKSPVVDVKKDSTMVMNGDAQITNNYYGAVNIAGELILNGDSDKGEVNRQLVNHHGYYVQLFDGSYLEMNGDSRILADEAITQIGSRACYGVLLNTTVADSVKILMKDNSAIERTEEGTLLSYGMYLTGGKTDVQMRNTAKITGSSAHGIYLSGAGNNLLMRDSSLIASAQGNGLYSYGTGARLEMRDSAEINMTKKSTGSWGVYLYNAPEFLMNANEDAGDGDSAKIISPSGIHVGTAGAKLTMKKHALISCNTESGLASAYLYPGIYFQGSGAAETKLTMADDSRITGYSNGIQLYSQDNPLAVLMQGRASVDTNYYGISEYTNSSGYGARKFHLTMEGASRISANIGYGIYLGGTRYFNADSYHKISMTGDALIGGKRFYEASDSTSGNGYAGIYASSPLQMEMAGDSRIAYNGRAGYLYNSTTFSNGIYLTRNTSYYRSGTSKITMSGDASICNNRGGVYVATTSTSYLNSCEFVLDGSGGIPKIQDNTDSVFMGRDATMKLQGLSYLGETTYQSDKRALDCYGKLELDGRSTVDGLIWLQTGTNPITLTYPVTDPLKTYRLWLNEGYLRHVVVQPDNRPGGVDDATLYFDRFVKAGGVGIAADKQLAKSAPNIILQGENNVYLSGSGNDANDGNSPQTAVRTFKRAKSLLETGQFNEGANIVICTSEVQVLSGDELWAFDDNGKVTNSWSHDTWSPLLVRHRGYVGRLISIPNGNSPATYAATVTFRNIIIDGGSEQGQILSTSSGSELMYVGPRGTAVLSTGAVFQNNKSSTTGYSDNSALGVLVYGGTLDISGGTIRNIVREITGSINNYWFGSAIYCYGTSSYPGQVLLKSGQIVDNAMDCPRATYASTRIGVIHIADMYSKFDMSGGLVENNRIVTGSNSPISGMILLYNGSANISGGIIRGNTASYAGSAIHYYSLSKDYGSLTFSGGQVIGNTTTANGIKPQGLYSPIYVRGYDFRLDGGGADIRDNIYLYSNEHLIKVSQNIYQPGRLYHVFLNQGSGTVQFKKGSVVVQPSGEHVQDVTPFLSYFQVHSNPYILDRGQINRETGTVSGAKENQCLILMQGVYLDSENGKDSNNGTTPAKAVKTFTQAKHVGRAGIGTSDVADYYVIYVSGKATNTAEETEWNLPAPAYMSRYTGFPVYQTDGNETPEVEYAYYGFMIEPSYDLTLNQISIYGRRSIDSIINNGDSIVNVRDGIRVTVRKDSEQSTIIGRNYNIGEHVNPKTGSIDNLGSAGGAFRVEAGGVLDIQGGIIMETDAAEGSAIYLGASKTDPDKFGHLYLSGSPSITGKTHLAGTSNVTAAYVEPDGSYTPASPLEIAIGNDYNGRPVIRYTDGTTPGYQETLHYKFDDSIKGLYDISNRADAQEMLELNMRRAIYLDGKNGNDEWDGATPETAYRTLKKVYDSIGTGSSTNGILVYVVNTVEISESTPDITLNNIFIRSGSGYYQGRYQESGGPDIEIVGQVYFKRYVQPDGYNADDPEYTGFAKPSLKDAPLFKITAGGVLTLNGIYIDGHSQDSDGALKTLVAKGIDAMAPLVVVETGGELISRVVDKSNIDNGIDTATLFTNNVNVRQKTNVIGKLNGSDIIEGTGAGIELLGGKATFVQTAFTNLALGSNVVSGGTDVYTNGEMHFSDRTSFGGNVFLEGFGTALNEESHATSKYLYVDEYGEPAVKDFQVLMRDPYNGRIVIHYLERAGGPVDSQVGRYRLEERVKDYFYLGKRPGAEYILELQVPVAVYIDGTNGEDNPESLVAGSTPATPVKSLKRAFELLKTRAGNTIYVVNTVQIDANVDINGTSYLGADGSILLGSTDKVQIVRYIQPDFAYYATGAEIEEVKKAGYDVADFTGVLLNVNSGVTAKFGSNVFIDGHSEKKDEDNYGRAARVSRTSESAAPLIMVEKNGTLELQTGAILKDNNNTYDAENGADGLDGGVLYNSGTASVSGAVFANNHAAKGAGVYQDGTFTIVNAPENIISHSFYLTTVNNGTPEEPSWAADHIIQTKVAIPEGQTFDVDMDHAVKGRDVVKFTDPTAYDPDVDAEHDHFVLGSTVPDNLFLVQAIDDESVLELQNWEILDVQVPSDIYLVMQRNSYIGDTTRLMGVDKDVTGTDLLSAPEYSITNNGRYDVKISVRGFNNRNSEVGITHEIMTLKGAADTVSGNTDLYLAVKGLDDNGSDGFAMAETALSDYAAEAVTADPAAMGVLKSGSTGRFTFTGAAGGGFIDKYMDPTFPMSGISKDEVQDYMDGTSGTVNARAKYELKFKLELVPSRRKNND